MKVKRYVGSKKYLKADHLGENRAITVQILRVVLETMRGHDGKDEQKPVMYFTGHTRGLVLNVETTNTLSEIFRTDESETWLGKSIVLFTTMVRVGGESKLAIRVRAVTPSTTSTGQPHPQRDPAAPAPKAGDPVHSSDIRW